MNFRCRSKASNLRQPKLSASYKETVAAIFQSVNIIFLKFSGHFQQKFPICPITAIFEKSQGWGGGGGGSDCEIVIRAIFFFFFKLRYFTGQNKYYPQAREIVLRSHSMIITCFQETSQVLDGNTDYIHKESIRQLEDVYNVF